MSNNSTASLSGQRVVVTGSAGFIGSNFVLDWIAQTGGTIVNLDKLTYAGNLENLKSLQGDPRDVFIIWISVMVLWGPISCGRPTLDIPESSAAD